MLTPKGYGLHHVWILLKNMVYMDTLKNMVYMDTPEEYGLYGYSEEYGSQ